MVHPYTTLCQCREYAQQLNQYYHWNYLSLYKTITNYLLLQIFKLWDIKLDIQEM